MNTALQDLGLEYAADTSDYDILRMQIYEYYGYKQPRDFPEPLWAASTQSYDREQFFKSLMHKDAIALLPYVEQALYNQINNPYASRGMDIDRETLAQLVDTASQLARAAGATPDRAMLNMLMLAEMLVWQS